MPENPASYRGVRTKSYLFNKAGYGRPWEIKRARIMKRDKYLCQNCRRDGIATKASSVDHIIPKAHGGTDDDFNLESLCWTCHSKKTATERTR
ncbi:HNH endonuclease [Klebsiella pneumoniae]|uniref:HNH endonuclease n=1 Tax=Klebsiella pneumoniae TaxID=573 RepID=UPI0035CEB8A7